MKREEAMAHSIAEQVAAAGGRAYYVGGCVRDRLLKRETVDVDLEIHGIPEETLLHILDGLGERTSMGRSFGVFGLKHVDLDIAMPRKADSRETVDPWIGTTEAARRRDLTINAMLQDVLTGELLDPFGGMEDLRRGVLRHVDPDTFREDPLRVFRTARFSARFGFAVTEETVSLCRTVEVSGLARERVFEELRKALRDSPRPSVFFAVLRQMECLQDWFPEVAALIGIPQDPVHHPEGDVWNHTMAVLDAAAALQDRAEQPTALMLAALCHDFGKVTATQVEGDRIHALGHEEAGLVPAADFLKRLTGETALHGYVQNMLLLHMRPNLLAAQGAKAKALCTMFDRSVCPADLLLLARADHFGKLGASPYEDTERFLREALALFRDRMAQPHVTGADLLQAGCAPGPQMGAALAFAHKLRLAGVSKETALKQTLSWLRQQI